MRITILSWRDLWNPRAGGAERVTYEHARSWVRSGHDVTLFTSLYNGAARSEMRDGIRVVRAGSEWTVHWLARLWYCRQRDRADLVIDEIHGVPFLAPSYARVPVVAWIYEVARDLWFQMYPSPIAVLGKTIESAALRWYGQCNITFVADSKSTLQDLQWSGVNGQRVHIIAPGIRVQPLVAAPEKEGQPTLIFVGRLVRMKGVEDALRSFKHLVGLVPECRLWIVGSGDAKYESRLRALAKSLGVAHSVSFLGRVSEEEKLWRLSRAHLLIHPSQREGWGINVIEANAVGTPAIGYDVAGLRDSIVGGRTGLLSPRGQPERLAASAVRLLVNREMYRRFQANALEWSARFTWESATRQSLRVLHEVAACKP